MRQGWGSMGSKGCYETQSLLRTGLYPMLIWQKGNSSSCPTRKHLCILIAKPMLNAECRFPNLYLPERLWFRDTDNSSRMSDLRQIPPLAPLSHPRSLSAVPGIHWAQVCPSTPAVRSAWKALQPPLKPLGSLLKCYVLQCHRTLSKIALPPSATLSPKPVLIFCFHLLPSDIL